MSGSQSSLLSTPGNSADSNECRSAEWPEPPEMPICSTEDEATSLHSDSGKFFHQILKNPNFVCSH